jgi:O-antigen ligase
MLGTLVFLLAVFTFNDEIQRQVLQSLSRNPWRFEIWMDAWKYIQNAPIIGNGLASLNTFGAIEQKFPHSIYVSSAFFGGAIGLFLLLALFAQLAWAALNTEDKTTKAFHLGLLCVPVIGGLTDLAQVSKSPGELWYILWVPVTIIIGHSIKSRREQKQQAQQSSIE